MAVSARGSSACLPTLWAMNTRRRWFPAQALEVLESQVHKHSTRKHWKYSSMNVRRSFIDFLGGLHTDTERPKHQHKKASQYFWRWSLWWWKNTVKLSAVFPSYWTACSVHSLWYRQHKTKTSAMKISDVQLSGTVFVQQCSFKEELVVIWNQVCLPRQPAVADDVLRSVFKVLQNTHTRTITQEHTEHTYSRNYSSAHQGRKEGQAL